MRSLHAEEDRALEMPFHYTQFGAVLMVDIVGFSQVMESPWNGVERVKESEGMGVQCCEFLGMPLTGDQNIFFLPCPETNLDGSLL